jgi:hypothetical protein
MAHAPDAFRPVLAGGWRRGALNGFIAFHVLAVSAWLTPATWPPRDRLVRPIAPYIQFLGLWQAWGMFAPEPLAYNVHVEADVTFEDGSVRRWTPPRMADLDGFSRYRKERWRRWTEVIRLDEKRVAWPDAARFVARLHAHPLNPPVAVTLHRRWAAVPPIGTGLKARERQLRHHHVAFFTYRLVPGDLP